MSSVLSIDCNKLFHRFLLRRERTLEACEKIVAGMSPDKLQTVRHAPGNMMFYVAGSSAEITSRLNFPAIHALLRRWEEIVGSALTSADAEQDLLSMESRWDAKIGGPTLGWREIARAALEEDQDALAAALVAHFPVGRAREADEHVSRFLLFALPSRWAR